MGPGCQAGFGAGACCAGPGFLGRAEERGAGRIGPSWVGFAGIWGWFSSSFSFSNNTQPI